MRVLIYNSEDYVDVEHGPQNHICRRPILHCGIDIEAREFTFNLRLDKGQTSVDADGAVRAAREFRPAVVIYNQAGYGRNLPLQAFAAIRETGARIVSAIYDTTIIKDLSTLRLLEASDYLLVFDSIYSYVEFSLLSETLHRGAKRVLFSGGYLDTSVMPPASAIRDRDVSFVGSRTGMRPEFLERLSAHLAKEGVGITFAGGFAEAAGDEPDRHFMPLDRYFHALRRSRIVLNLQSEPFRDQIKYRIYETMAAGSLCLTDGGPDIEAMFPGGVLATFEQVEDCAGSVLSLLANESERAAIAERGRQWFNETFDWRRFWSMLLRSAAGENVVIPQPPAVETALSSARSVLRLIQPEFAHLVRLARTLSVHGLTDRTENPFLTLGSLASTHPDIRGHVEGVPLGIGFFGGAAGTRAAMLAGWGLEIEPPPK
jgi:hypothetical protein